MVGMFSITSCVVVTVTPTFRVSTIGLWPLTVIVSATVATFSMGFRSTVPPVMTRRSSSW
jgi:hypothetical protein